MSFILVILLFTGNTELQYFKDKASCEAALERKVDFGNYKHIDEIYCLESIGEWYEPKTVIWYHRTWYYNVRTN